jgi:release factor glutamine methyltransferase
MTIRQTKIFGIKKLRHGSKESAPIDAEILLAHALGITREKMLAHDDQGVPALAAKKYRAYLSRRVKYEPVAYIIGRKEFFGLPFFVNKHTLIPRPETELLVEEALGIITHPSLPYLKGGKEPNHFVGGKKAIPPLSQPKADPPRAEIRGGEEGLLPVIIDIGTGSGAIAIAIAKNAPNTTVIATDISSAALKIANRNAALNDVQDQIIFERANLLPPKIPRSPFFERVVITANLPYLPTKVWQKCPPDVKKFEPKNALLGGADGLKYYDELFHQIIERNIKAMVICEIDPSQKKSFPKLVKRHFPAASVKIKNDLAGLARVAVFST